MLSADASAESGIFGIGHLRTTQLLKTFSIDLFYINVSGKKGPSGSKSRKPFLAYVNSFIFTESEFVRYMTSRHI